MSKSDSDTTGGSVRKGSISDLLRPTVSKVMVLAVAAAIKDAIGIECHTYKTYSLDYEAAAVAAIAAMRRSESDVR